MARIYSVAVPALILTLILFYAGKYVNIAHLDGLDSRLDHPLWIIASALLFINQSWIDTTVFTNLPYWSLGYEVLYYVFFGVWFYARKNTRLIAIPIIFSIMGPSILLYLPIWLLGVFCHRNLNSIKLSFQTAFGLYILSITGIVILSIDSLQAFISTTTQDFFNYNVNYVLLPSAHNFVSDYILAIFVALHINSSYYLFKAKPYFSFKSGQRIQNLSSHTFSLYLYHMPLLYFFSAIFPFNQYSALSFFSSYLLTPILIYLLSRYTENKKSQFKHFFKEFFLLFFKHTRKSRWHTR